MGLPTWFKSKPPVVNVHVHIDAAAIDAKQLAEKVRAELLRAERRGGITKRGEKFFLV